MESGGGMRPDIALQCDKHLTQSAGSARKFGTARQDFNHLKIAFYGKSTILTKSFGAEMQECKVYLNKKDPDAHRAAGMKVRENEKCM